MDRMKTLLESYYGVGLNETAKEEDGRNLDSGNFKVGTYVSERLKNTTFAELLSVDDKLVGEVRTLDADMQLLVYDNYSKFISATDTIRSMKDNVDRIEGEIAALATKVEKIEQDADKMSERMAPRRSKIEKLVGLQNLIRKLNFLFELPIRLKECIDMDAPAQAVFYYKRAVPILEKHSEVASFANIERESHQIMQDLKTSLRCKLKDRTLRVDTFSEAMRLYIELHKENTIVPSELKELREEFLEWSDGYVGERIGDIDSRQTELSLRAFVETVCSNILEPVSEICMSFSEIFLLSKDDEATSLLQEFAKTQLTLVVNVVRRRLVSDDVTSTYRDSLEGCSDPGEEEDCYEGVEVRSLHRSTGQYKSLLSALNVLFGRFKAFEIRGVVRSGFLLDRATEISEHAIRKQVVSAFDSLRETVTDLFTEFYNACVEKESAQILEGKETSAQSKAVQLLSLVEEAVAKTMKNLNTLLQESSEILSEMAAIFDNLIKFQLRFWVIWLANALECFCDPFHAFRKPLDGADTVSIPDTSRERSKILVVAPIHMYIPPFFVLCLVCFTERLGRSRVAASVTDLSRELKETRDNLLQTYVELCASNICITARPELEEPSGMHLGTDEPNDVRPFATNFVQKLSDVSKEIAACLGEERSVADSSLSSSAIGVVGPGTRSSNRFGRKPSTALGQNVQMDIERMFSQKVEILGHIDFTSTSICTGIVKIVLKSVFEYVRRGTLSKHNFQQMEVDTFFLRSMFPILLEDTTVVNSLLAQILSAARERSLDPVPFPQEKIDSLCRGTREALRLNLPSN